MRAYYFHCHYLIDSLLYIFGILRFYELTWNLVKLPSLLAIVDYDLMKILTQKPSSFIWCNNRETFNFNFSDLKNIVHKIRTSKNSVGICSDNQILLVPNKSYEKPPEPVCIYLQSGFEKIPIANSSATKAPKEIYQIIIKPDLKRAKTFLKDFFFFQKEIEYLIKKTA